MNAHNNRLIAWAAIIGLLLWPALPWAFDSGSSGADGAFAPTESQEIQLPANGIFNYTTVNIPAGVTIRYLRNTINSPAVILASGDVVIDGEVNVDGDEGDNFNDNLTGGPGGFPGGRGGLVDSAGSNGLGPGGVEGDSSPASAAEVAADLALLDQASLPLLGGQSMAPGFCNL